MKNSIPMSNLILEEIELMKSHRSKIATAQQNLLEYKLSLRFKHDLTILNEYHAAAMDKDFKIEEPWPTNKAVDTYLTKQSKLNKNENPTAFPNGINPHGFEIDSQTEITSKNSKKTYLDRLWIYSHNEIWSTNMRKAFGYSFANNKFIVWLNPDVVNSDDPIHKVGYFLLQGKQWKFTVTLEDPKPGYGDTELPDTKANTWIDTLQTILDWVGFIPVYGDIVDLVNGIIYFIRGKWFDGILSMIAIIPLVGSAIKISAKAIYKGTRLVKLVDKIKTAWKGKDSAKIFEELARSGAITPSQYRLIGDGIEKVADLLRSGKKSAKYIPFMPNDALKQLDELEIFLSKGGHKMSDLADAVKRGKKLPSNIIPSVASGANLTKQASRASEGAFKMTARFLGNTITAGVIPILRTMKFSSPRQLKNLANAIDIRFLRDFARPDKLSAVIKSSSGIGQTASKALKDATRRFAPKGVKNVKMNATQLANFFATWQKKSPGSYADFSNKILKDQMSPGSSSMLYNAFKNDNVINLKSYLSRDMIPGGSSWLSQCERQWKKSVDVIWNEIHDVAEDVQIEIRPGVDSYESKVDEVDGFVWSGIKMMLSKVFPGTTKAVAASINDLRTSDFAKAAIDYFEDKSMQNYSIDGGTDGDAGYIDSDGKLVTVGLHK